MKQMTMQNMSNVRYLSLYGLHGSPLTVGSATYSERTDERTDERMDERTDERTEERTDKRTDE